MATFEIEANSPLAKAITNTIQPQLIANGWVSEETDVTLAEYITMMLVNGHSQEALVSELGTDLLGAEPGDERPAQFGKDLFEQVRALAAAEQQSQTPAQQPSEQQPASSDQDTQMSVDATPIENAPTGPRSMRSGHTTRGRGGRMLGQMNRTMDRTQELPDTLRRIKGAAGGQSGRINTHSRDNAPRGPRNGSGIQRMAAGRGGNLANMGIMNNPMAQGALGQGPMGAVTPQQQMQFMQMMEMQSQLMAQFLQQGTQPGMAGHNHQGGHRGGRGGGAKRSQQAHAVNGKLPDGPLQAGGGDTMDVDAGERKDAFSTMCHFNMSCTNPACGFAHQSPAAPAGTIVDLTDTCPHGIACVNSKCSARHPSPALKNQHAKQEVDCKFYPNCTNPRCPFKHPSDMPPCRNGADCTVPNCKFSHSKIACRYNPCLNPNCAFKHTEGQRGKFTDKVWTANGGSGGEQQQQNSKADRFEAFSKQGGSQNEELILPNANANVNGSATDGDVQVSMQEAPQAAT